MGKNKLKRFEETATFPNFFQLPCQYLTEPYYLQGKWANDFFKNDFPIVLELGCGKGEYTLELAERYPRKNFIGVDIKGARMWRGCKTSLEKRLKNIAFLRTQIESIHYFFGVNEVSEIWIPFPDPQPKNSQEKKRLTSERFLDLYKKFIRPKGIIHLKTDNEALFNYTLDVIKSNRYKLIYSTDNLYVEGKDQEAASIQTFYEKKFLAQQLTIKYLRFHL